MRLPRPSIQPWHNATSTASAAVIEAMPADFLAILTNTPGARSCSASSHASKSAAVAKARTGKVLSSATGPSWSARRSASSARGFVVGLPGYGSLDGVRVRAPRRRTGRRMPQEPGPSALWLVRHGESLGNLADAQAHADGSGRLELDVRDPDVPLSPTGESQADALARRLAALPPDQRPTTVLSSPFTRAATTAQRAVAGLGRELTIRYDERLRERDFG